MSSTTKSVPIGCRVYASCSQGGRKYMEDTYALNYQTSASNSDDLSFVYMAIFDGHGGDMAANYARDHLLYNIIRQRAFWVTDNDNQVLQAISKGFLQTHYDMMKEVVNWPKTASGLNSTSGTTASIVFIMNGKYYTGHVGDSRIVLGRRNPSTGKWMAFSLTRDHKPESPREKKRIEAAGGQVMNKSGVDRVVWNRPKLGHKGPVRRSTSFDQIPFLAVARSLGDLWSFNSELNTFIVSPEPDVKCLPIDPNDKCLLLASDGLWNMMMTQTAVKVIQEVEEDKYSPELMEAVFGHGSNPLSPSRALVHFCLNRWFQSRFRADNTTVLAALIDHNQDIELNTNPQNNYSINPNGYAFSDEEEEEDSDDGYVEEFDATSFDFFGQLIDYNKNNAFNNNKYITSDVYHQIIPSSLPTEVNGTVNTSQTNLNIISSIDNLNTNKSNQSKDCETKATPNLISGSNESLNSENDNFQTSKTDTETTNQTITEETNSDFDDNQLNESSRDSGTVSPIAITTSDQLTDEEYAALPSLVNLSQNQWELFVEIDPKNLDSKTTNFSVLTNSEDNNSLNNYIYCKSFAKQQLTHNFSQNNSSEMKLTDNYWSENSSYFTLTSIKPRTSLPYNFDDNHSTNYSHVSNNRSSIDDNLNIFGPLKTQSNNNNNNTPIDNKMFSQFHESNNELINKNLNDYNNRSREFCLRNSTLLRRITIDNKHNKPRVTLPPRSATKRKYSPDFSPPSKHLRSSLWTRPLVSKEQLMKLSFTRSLKQLAVGRLTRSRLRPIKLLTSFKSNSRK